MFAFKNVIIHICINSVFAQQQETIILLQYCGISKQYGRGATPTDY